MNVRIYAPISDGAFADMVDEMRKAGWSCDASSRSVKCKRGDAAFKFVSDDEELRAQILAGPDSLWSTIESFRTRVSGDVGAHLEAGAPYWRRQPTSNANADGHQGSAVDVEQLGASDDGRFVRVSLAGSIVWVPSASVSGDDDAPASMVEGDEGTLWPSDPDKMNGIGERARGLKVNGRAYMGPRARVGASSDRSKTYGPYSSQTAQSFLDKVKRYGMTVSGNNPWSIDANQHGITLTAAQDGSGRVTVTVTGRNFYVSLAKIWEKVDPLMPRADVSGVTSRVGALPSDASVSWSALSKAMVKLDLAIGDEVQDAHGNVLIVGSDDWTPPLSTDPKAQIAFLEKVYDRTKEAIARADTLTEDAKRNVEYEARMAVAKAQKLAHDVNQKLEIVATPEIAASWKERGKAIEEKLDDAKETLETGAKWYLGAIAGVAVGWWAVVAVGAYIYFKKGGRERLAA